MRQGVDSHPQYTLPWTNDQVDSRAVKCGAVGCVHCSAFWNRIRDVGRGEPSTIRTPRSKMDVT